MGIGATTLTLGQVAYTHTTKEGAKGAAGTPATTVIERGDELPYNQSGFSSY